MQATTRPLPPELDAWRPRLAQLAAAALAEQGPDGAHDLNHFERVWRNAQALLAHYPQADALVVMAACYLHDLVNVPKDDPRRSSASRLSAGLASERLAALRFPADKLAAVAHAIEAHSFSAAVPATTLEARIVRTPTVSTASAPWASPACSTSRAAWAAASPMAMTRSRASARWTTSRMRSITSTPSSRACPA